MMGGLWVHSPRGCCSGGAGGVRATAAHQPACLPACPPFRCQLVIKDGPHSALVCDALPANLQHFMHIVLQVGGRGRKVQAGGQM